MQSPALRYLLIAFLSAAAATVICLALGIFADPYRMFGSERLLWSPPVKPRIYQQALLAKSYMLLRVPVRTLVLGNSRAEIGIDPRSRSWPVESRPVFNGALAAHDLYAAVILLRHRMVLRPPAAVMLGIDFQDFIGIGQRNEHQAAGAEEIRLLADRDGRPNPGRGLQVAKDIVATTLSLDAVVDSVTTIFDQDRRYGETMTPDGFNPLRPYLRERPNELFSAKLADYYSSYAKFHPSDFSKPSVNSEFGYLATILQVCSSKHLPLTIFTHPYHAAYLEMLHRQGLWTSFEAWKRAIVKFVTARDPSAKILDFSIYSALTEEPLAQSAVPMRWYWEPGHYKSEAGDLMIADFFSPNPRFGVSINPQNVETDIIAIRVERSNWLKRGAHSQHQPARVSAADKRSACGRGLRSASCAH